MTIISSTDRCESMVDKRRFLAGVIGIYRRLWMNRRECSDSSINTRVPADRDRWDSIIIVVSFRRGRAIQRCARKRRKLGFFFFTAGSAFLGLFFSNDLFTVAAALSRFSSFSEKFAGKKKNSGGWSIDKWGYSSYRAGDWFFFFFLPPQDVIWQDYGTRRYIPAFPDWPPSCFVKSGSRLFDKNGK